MLTVPDPLLYSQVQTGKTLSASNSYIVPPDSGMEGLCAGVNPQSNTVAVGCRNSRVMVGGGCATLMGPTDAVQALGDVERSHKRGLKQQQFYVCVFSAALFHCAQDSSCFKFPSAMSEGMHS